ncbi:hypothetical protein FRC12_014640 [Ceratobasidium sp. 428]|nr:hypothetical protein FRC12_014640 [Ceratobasidium sp. 428]
MPKSDIISEDQPVEQNTSPNEAVSPAKTAHTNPPDAEASNIASLIQQSSEFFDRFQNQGTPAFLNESIAGYTRAIELTRAGDTGQVSLLHNLALAYFFRFMGLNNASDIDQSILCWTQAISLTNDGDPNKFDRLNNLGNSYAQKFQCLGDTDALDGSISSFETAISLAPNDHKILPGLHNNLGNTYSLRFQLCPGEESYIHQAIRHQTQCLSLTPVEHPAKPGWLRNLGDSYMLRFVRLGVLTDINSAIDCHSQAAALTTEEDPNKAARFSSLGTAYQNRFEALGNISDIDESISYHIQAVTVAPDGNHEKCRWLNNLGVAYGCRARYLDNIEDTDKGILRQEEALGICPTGDARQAVEINSNLGGLYLQRFHSTKNLDDMDKAIACTTQSVSILPSNHPNKSSQCNNLALAFRERFDASHSTSDLDQAISLHRQALALAADGHPQKHRFLSNIGSAYYARYRLPEGGPVDLKQAIIYQIQGLDLCPRDHPERGIRLAAMARALAHSARQSQDATASEAAIVLLAESARSSATTTSIRFDSAWQYARLLTKSYPSKALEGWSLVMELLPTMVWQGHTVTRRYQEVAKISDVVSDAMSAAIICQSYGTAIEWLEEGHAMVWRQILQLRTPIDELESVNPELASQLQRVSHELERVGTSRILEDPDRQLDRAGMDELATQRHHRLAQDWDKLVRSVRETPSFEDFLRPNKLKNLAAITHSGAVVAIHVGRKICGALILQPDSSDVIYLALPQFSREKATNAYNRLKHLLHDGGMRDSEQRKFVKHSTHYDTPFQFVLALLWTEVVKPVLDCLGYKKQSSPEELPHITWCTTGPLSFLPLHAAGLYFDATSDEKVFNYIISSYTPTLSALLPSENRSDEFNGILAVAQSETPGQTSLPGATDELRLITQRFGENAVVRLEGSNATVKSVISAMENSSWVHMACHASQNSDAPGTSAFYLHDGPLKLSTIMNQSLKNAEFAFLSACQTASGDEDLPDEAVHLAAGMLMAGYRTVIATAWSIRDVDAPLIADRVYAHLLLNGRPDSRRASMALHLAVKELRDKIGENSFVSWVPYIHIGV